MKRILFFLFFLFFIVSPFVLAIGVSPGSIRLNYDEGAVIPFEMRIINQGTSNNVQMYVQGWMSPYVALSEYDFSFDGQRLFAINGTLKMPPYEDITEYGPQRIFIAAKDVVPKDAGGISAVAAVKMWIEVDIPFPGKYARIESLTAEHILKGENTSVMFVVLNRGTNDLSGTKLVLSLINFEGEEVASKEFNNIFIPVNQRKTINHTFLTENFDSGIYRVKGTFFYDTGDSLEKEDMFFIGTSDIVLTNYTKFLKKGEINKVNLTLQSIWGSPLENIRLTISTDSEDFPLSVLDLSPFEKKAVVGFVDVPDFQEDTLNATLKIILPVDNDVIIEKDIPLFFNILEPPKKELALPINTVTLLFVALGLLLLILVINIFFFRGKSSIKKKNRSSKHKK